MISTVTGIDYYSDVALVTVNNIPDTPENLAKILREMANRQVPVDMICRTASCKKRFTLSFTIPQENLGDVIGATAVFKGLDAGISTDVNGNNIKVVLSGKEMCSRCGVAAEVFQVFDDGKIPVKLITTAETEISCLVDIKDIGQVKELLKGK